jgi:hypothetical protein
MRSTTLRSWNPARFAWSTMCRAPWSAAERSETAARPLQNVADPVAAELEAALALRRSAADAKVLRRALRRIEGP